MKNTINCALLCLVIGTFVGCSNPNSGGQKASDQTMVEPNGAINMTTSYFRLLGTKLIYPSRIPLARTYFSLKANGVQDLISADLSGTTAATKVRFFKNDGNDNFIEDSTVFDGDIPVLVHARKAISNDFDADGFEDIVITGHGFDQPPFPGEVPVIIRNRSGNSLVSTGLPVSAGFYHSVCSGDINNDGYPDLFLTPPVFLINDKKGNLTVDAALFPAEWAEDAYYTSELFDLNADGYLDLIVTGHEQDGGVSRVLWGNKSGKYLPNKASSLPAVPGYGVAIGISLSDVTGDGIVDILLNRTGDPTGPGFYTGYYLQLIDGSSLADISQVRIHQNYSSTSQWLYWVRFFDSNKDGKLDIVVDDASLAKTWLNSGNNIFGEI